MKDLEEFDGTNDKPVYIAFEGRVIDVSNSQYWQHGRHMGSHQAGRDMTREIGASPHGPEKLETFPQVGVLSLTEKSQEEISPFLARLFHAIPLLRRHPHPMLVHFPLVFMLATTAFNLLYLLTGNPSFEETAWHCLWGGVLFLPPAIVTGLFTWWINYQAEWLRPIKFKIGLSALAISYFPNCSALALFPPRHFTFLATAQPVVWCLDPFSDASGNCPWLVWRQSLSFPLKE